MAFLNYINLSYENELHQLGVKLTSYERVRFKTLQVLMAHGVFATGVRILGVACLYQFCL